MVEIKILMILLYPSDFRMLLNRAVAQVFVINRA